MVGLIGSSSSNPTAAMATIAGLPNLNLALVGFHAGSPTLSDVKKYPTFLRVNPIITGVIDAIINLMQRTFSALTTHILLTKCPGLSFKVVFTRNAHRVNLQFTQPYNHLPLSKHSPCEYFQIFVGLVRTTCTRPLTFSPQVLTKPSSISHPGKTFD